MNANLSQIIELEQLDVNLFRSKFHRENFRRTLFGGQVISQALAAATATVEGRLPHSLHAYFLRPGSSDVPVIYDVDIVRDGRSISSRRIVCRQKGKAILNMSVSFQVEEEGFEHADVAPQTAAAEELLKQRIDSLEQPNMPSHTYNPEQTAAPFQLVPVKETLFIDKEPAAPEALLWLRANERLSDSTLVHLSALTFASDFGLLATSLLPHRATLFDDDMFTASIDHAMWFHTVDFRADEWLLCRIHSPWAGNGRGFSIGSIFNQSGKLVASMAQEGLVRKLSKLE